MPGKEIFNSGASSECPGRVMFTPGWEPFESGVEPPKEMPTSDV
jgi:hypothetical protein